ncbi:hypothetical protein EXN66_Car014525 [Channa argus]|uniref:Uncharacterized protein n=1 Tax=Channa argus TaxID=215402 RepID=A0A6G1Q991_CHAAH|nr:hypothetical protein EXN66_Car014525 [Channa argus]
MQPDVRSRLPPPASLAAVMLDGVKSTGEVEKHDPHSTHRGLQQIYTMKTKEHSKQQKAEVGEWMQKHYLVTEYHLDHVIKKRKKHGHGLNLPGADFPQKPSECAGKGLAREAN